VPRGVKIPGQKKEGEKEKHYSSKDGATSGKEDFVNTSIKKSRKALKKKRRDNGNQYLNHTT